MDVQPSVSAWNLVTMARKLWLSSLPHLKIVIFYGTAHSIPLSIQMRQLLVAHKIVLGSPTTIGTLTRIVNQVNQTSSFTVKFFHHGLSRALENRAL